MAFSLVTNVGLTPSGNSGGTTSAVDTTGANLIVVGVTGLAGFAGNATVSDNKGNTYTSLTRRGSGGSSSWIFYCSIPTVGSGHTFTLGGLCLGSMVVQAWSGAATSSVLDAESGAISAGGASTVQAPSITPANAGSLFFTTACANTYAATFTIDSSFTITDQVLGIGGNPSAGDAGAYKVSGSAESPTWTSSLATTGADMTTAMAVFVPGASGITGSAAWTEAQDTWAGTGTVLVSGSAAWTEGPDIWAGTGGIFAMGTVAWTEGPDIWAGTGTVAAGISGSAAWIEAPDAWAGTGAVLVSGSAAWTEGPDIWSGTGTITLPDVTGVGAWTEAADSWAGLGNNGQAQTGGHFIPLTRKQEQELQKRRRKERKAQEAAWDEKRLDADSIAADMRAQLLPPKTIAEVINEVTEADDDDEDLELILLNA